MLDMAANREDTLPTRDRVGAHDGVDGLQLATNVFRSAPRLVVELKPCVFCHLPEIWLLKRGGKTFEELLVRFTDAVVDFIARSPQRIFIGSVLAIAT